ncbi:MAG: small-conductance mechanosensitive channel [Bradymonadia bacterium]|jgi:small-conductance mechanosensitive channel
MTPEHLQLVAKAVITIALIVLFLLGRFTLTRVVLPQIVKPERRYSVGKYTRYALLALLIFALVWTWVGETQGLVTYFGIASAGIAIALQQPLLNLVGWAYIVSRRPFENGHRIEIGDLRGDVIDIGLMHTTMIEVGNWVKADQSTGRLLHVPNGWAITKATANASEGFGFVWDELELLVTFESDWEFAKDLILKAIEADSQSTRAQAMTQMDNASSEYVFLYRNLTPIVWTTIEDAGVLLTGRYLCEPRKRRSTRTLVSERILRELRNAPQVELAYPTTRFFHRLAEEPGARQAMDREQKKSETNGS